MIYFARISSQIHHANKLQEALLRHVQKYDNILVEDVDGLFSLIQEYAKQACRTYHRCAPQNATANRNYPDRTIRSINVGGLYTLTFHKVEGYYKEGGKITQTANFDQPKPEPAPPPVPTPEPVNEPVHDLPRLAIWKSREDDTPLRFEVLGKFHLQVQTRIQKGLIWAIYEDCFGAVWAEEFGGIKHKAF